MSYQNRRLLRGPDQGLYSHAQIKLLAYIKLHPGCSGAEALRAIGHDPCESEAYRPITALVRRKRVIKLFPKANQTALYLPGTEPGANQPLLPGISI